MRSLVAPFLVMTLCLVRMGFFLSTRGILGCPDNGRAMGIAYADESMRTSDGESMYLLGATLFANDDQSLDELVRLKARLPLFHLWEPREHAGGRRAPARPACVARASKSARATELLAVANDPSCYLGIDKRGNHWFARTNTDGTQTWVITRGGTIREGGRNQSPHLWDPVTGLSANPYKE